MIYVLGSRPLGYLGMDGGLDKRKRKSFICLL